MARTMEELFVEFVDKIRALNEDRIDFFRMDYLSDPPEPSEQCKAAWDALLKASKPIDAAMAAETGGQPVDPHRHV